MVAALLTDLFFIVCLLLNGDGFCLVGIAFRQLLLDFILLGFLFPYVLEVILFVTDLFLFHL
jgi:hypothetical protein